MSNDKTIQMIEGASDQELVNISKNAWLSANILARKDAGLLDVPEKYREVFHYLTLSAAAAFTLFERFEVSHESR